MTELDFDLRRILKIKVLQILSTEITNIEIFPFIAVPVFNLHDCTFNRCMPADAGWFTSKKDDN